MKKNLIIFFQIIIVLLGIGAIAFLLWEPHLEGRNASATLFQIYFNDPFLAYAYIASIPFFVGLYQVFQLLGYAGQNKIISHDSVKALQTIKYCAIITIGFVVVGEVFILLSDSDDHAGGVFIGLLITTASILTVIAATLYGRKLTQSLQKSSPPISQSQK